MVGFARVTCATSRMEERSKCWTGFCWVALSLFGDGVRSPVGCCSTWVFLVVNMEHGNSKGSLKDGGGIIIRLVDLLRIGKWG